MVPINHQHNYLAQPSPGNPYPSIQRITNVGRLKVKSAGSGSSDIGRGLNRPSQTADSLQITGGSAPLPPGSALDVPMQAPELLMGATTGLEVPQRSSSRDLDPLLHQPAVSHLVVEVSSYRLMDLLRLINLRSLGTLCTVNRPLVLGNHTHTTKLPCPKFVAGRIPITARIPPTLSLSQPRAFSHGLQHCYLPQVVHHLNLPQLRTIPTWQT